MRGRVIRTWENDLQPTTEKEGEDLQEEARHLDSLRPEVLEINVSKCQWQAAVEIRTYEEFTQHCSEAGETKTEEPHTEGEDGEGWVILERYETKSIILSVLDRTLLARGVKVDSTNVFGDLDNGQLGG